MTDWAGRSWFPGLLALIGGGAIVAGCRLTWLHVGGGVGVEGVSITGTPKGDELLTGKEALVTGVAVAFLGLMLLLNRGARMFLGLLVVVGGIIAVAIAAYVASSPRDRYIDFAVQKAALAGQTGEVNHSLVNLFDVSGQEADLGVGLLVVIAGGMSSIVGGLTVVAGRRKPTPADEVPEPTEAEPEPEGLPEEWLAARAKEAAARSVAVEEPPQQVLVAEPAWPPLPDPPPWPQDAVPLPEPPESPPPEEQPAGAEETEAPTEPAEEPAPTPEPVSETVAPPEPSAEPVKPDVRANWSKPLPDDWVAKPAKRRFRRRS